MSQPQRFGRCRESGAHQEETPLANLDGNIGRIVDFIGVRLQNEGAEELLSLWRQAEFSYYELESYGRYEGHVLNAIIPARLYHSIGLKRLKMQKSLKAFGDEAFAAFDRDYLEEVKIVPRAEDDSSWRLGFEAPVQIIEAEASRLWKPDMLRLFVSHRSNVKKPLAQVKQELLGYGVDCFLAHEEIRKTKKWRDMIMQGLLSCHAVLAVGTEGYAGSPWCNQEIGWGLARGVLVLPLLAGESPDGFHAEYQGPTSDLTDPAITAKSVAEALCEDERSAGLLFRGFAKIIEEAYSWETLRDVGYRLNHLDNCPVDELALVESAFKNNPKNDARFNTPHNFTNWIEGQRKKPH